MFRHHRSVNLSSINKAHIFLAMDNCNTDNRRCGVIHNSPNRLNLKHQLLSLKTSTQYIQYSDPNTVALTLQMSMRQDLIHRESEECSPDDGPGLAAALVQGVSDVQQREDIEVLLVQVHQAVERPGHD